METRYNEKHFFGLCAVFGGRTVVIVLMLITVWIVWATATVELLHTLFFSGATHLMKNSITRPHVDFQQ